MNKISDEFQKKEEERIELFKWVIENGGISTNMEMKYIDINNRYFVASNLIKKGEIINIIPEKLLITKLHPDVKMYYDILIEIPFFKEYCEQLSICSWMSIEMDDPNSFFFPYFNYLPKDYTCFPFYYTDEELSLLKGTSFLNEVFEKKKQLLNEVEELKVLIYHICFN